MSSGRAASASENRKNSISGAAYTVNPRPAARSRLRRSTQRGSPSNGSPSVVSTSQNILATPPEFGRPGSTWKVLVSGLATMSASCTRAKPSMAEPSKIMPCSKASSSSAGVIANDLRKPSTSVNHSRMKRMSHSSTIRRTYSRCLSMFRHAASGSGGHATWGPGGGAATSAGARRSRCYGGVVERLRLAGAQIDPVVGDVDGHVDRVLDAYRRAAERGAHLVVFPELAITGYPPEDLVFKPSFLAASRDAMERVAARTGEAAAVFGFVDSSHAGPANAAALCRGGQVLAVYHKILLPNYSVFDEERYFVPGDELLLAEFGDVGVAITICEDLWFPWGPLPSVANAGAEVVVSLNGSPYRLRKAERLRPMLAARAADH